MSFSALPEECLPLPDMEEGKSDLVITEDGPRLLGSVCEDCGDVCFPNRHSCLSCGSRKMRDTALPATGTLYTYSKVHISSTLPTPYTLGYVDLENGVRLLAQIKENDVPISMDCPVALQVDGDAYAFVPVSDAGDGK